MAEIRDVITGRLGGYACPDLETTDEHLETLRYRISQLQQEPVPIGGHHRVQVYLSELQEDLDLLLDRRLELAQPVH